MSLSTRNITKETITHLDPTPYPDAGTLLQIRSGKVRVLGEERSGIFKKRLSGRIFVSNTGVIGDEHVYYTHGGIERALLQYASGHYPDWRRETCPKPDLFDVGGFGENLVGTNMTEENVCVGDLYRIGDEVIVQVSEPRSPCYKLNIRFEWPRALKRVQRTGRVGWNYRVLRTGYIQEGDSIVLVHRPNPRWSLLNIKRVIQGKTVALPLVQELTELDVLTEMVREYAVKRLETTPKTYELVESRDVTSRVKQLTFALKEPFTIKRPQFHQFAFAQIEFGQVAKIARSYSIVSGDLNKFSLGVALDDHSRGGSAYLHKELKIGETIKMSPGGSPMAIEDEEKCIKEDCVSQRVIIIGGIGVTAFLPIVAQWEAEDTSYEIHYAVRSPEQAAFLDQLSTRKTTLYAKSRSERLCIDDIIPAVPAGEKYRRKIYCCGPDGLMNACRERAENLGYPAHMLHFESFGAAAGGPRGDPFEVDVKDIDSGRSASLKVPADKSLLQALRDTGFDMTYFCEAGGCGACKVTLCAGKVQHNGACLYEKEKSVALLTCVDRGIGKISIELD